LEELSESNLSDSIREFLRWSGSMPIYKSPFYSFVPGHQNFLIWATSLMLIEAIYKKERGKGVPKRIQFMHGFFDSTRGNMVEYKLFISLDPANGFEFGVIYGEYKLSDDIPTEQVLIADSIDDFSSKYLNFLESIPAREAPSFPDIDKLLETPTDLFEFVSYYNWDHGQEKMEYIASSNKCDRATALLIYWLLCPYYYYNDTPGKEFLMPFIIEENFKNSFYNDSDNTFNPHDHMGINFIDEYEEASKLREVPDFILKMTV
jgi:hypothetical protein